MYPLPIRGGYQACNHDRQGNMGLGLFLIDVALRSHVRPLAATTSLDHIIQCTNHKHTGTGSQGDRYVGTICDHPKERLCFISLCWRLVGYLYLCSIVVLIHLEWCIRKPLSSSTIFYNNNIIAHNHHTSPELSPLCCALGARTLVVFSKQLINFVLLSFSCFAVGAIINHLKDLSQSINLSYSTIALALHITIALRIIQI